MITCGSIFAFQSRIIYPACLALKVPEERDEGTPPNYFNIPPGAPRSVYTILMTF